MQKTPKRADYDEDWLPSMPLVLPNAYRGMRWRSGHGRPHARGTPKVPAQVSALMRARAHRSDEKRTATTRSEASSPTVRCAQRRECTLQRDMGETRKVERERENERWVTGAAVTADRHPLRRTTCCFDAYRTRSMMPRQGRSQSRLEAPPEGQGGEGWG